MKPEQVTFDTLLGRVAATLPQIRTDSRRVGPGDVFVAVPGVAVDGAAFITQAVAQGATMVVCRADGLQHLPEAAFAVAVHDDPRAALGALGQARYGTASLPFPVVGVTGTNGKTTITYLLEHLFASAGRRCGVLGTVSYRWPGHVETAPLTTPDCLQLHEMLGQMAGAGVDVAFMEVSSHALDQERVAGIRFAGAVLTNLTQDHLDYHGDMETYFNAKARLFRELPEVSKHCAVNADDPWGRRLLADLPGAVGFALTGAPVSGTRHLHGEMLRCSTAGVHLRMHFEGRTWEVDSPLVGAHNASNLLAVQAVGLGLGLSPADFVHLENFTGVPGRLERITNDRGLDVFVDYAHTPDALVNVLRALRDVGFTRIVTVFGCGGNRDRTKRPLMGAAVAAHADVAVLTSDNPRHEDPLAIMEDVKPGLAGAREVVAEADRRKAIALALEMLRPGDALLVAGKGHEDYQQVGDRKLPFSDQQTIREILGCN
ncbi:UDP-N-acetylmuramoyl-L-alanyl-D-glutamate--2,6-diaminopimelate ligase [Nitratidesulfovibrio vulgaris]|uniref:UDP-N-acetylmuramoyl-L-alanyl-D-glutamate--2,6-diaminopimelate ligase n=1 Tax=Nitratidesulfovibrio vulgaris (strain DP4) TaxID=391774 RepID=A0A0H3A608_NITV4|nr:UDP-N-acetylmuramoyl-L-alanyl-D-glutamate--2,6-diaminopimelate ligase [Nitratidesulfovibrio vulgaris]ABM27759.1 UDP-N-acetylmuramoylalanyl-D-glutamate--2,6-diaminopimelate ligase [Nitratidesulfovibrio vulgaris DP4]GEB80945.1 UDP-N-acetylmuramoyl-L-alanyl-D-glutamate--2,6-diaminopimelate ligase [Desulfovibrio desulfuricans]